MYKKFTSALTWNSINVFIYKTILLLHQIIIFYFIPNELYGISGTLFAALYLLIGLTNFGFEYSLFTFFSQYSKNKKTIKSLLVQCALKITCTLITALIINKTITFITSKTTTYSFFLFKFPIQLLPYLITLFITESLRIYLETIAQLAFLNKQIAIIQITTLLSYVTLVWSSYFIYGKITIEAIFIPMVIISIVEIIWIALKLLSWYKTIPPSLPSDNNSTTIAIIKKEQVDNFINQLSKNLFSPNFLMLLIAFVVGIKQAGIIRYFTNIITLLYMLFSKAIAIPSGAVFSNMKNIDFEKTKKIFLTITNAYIQLLYILAIIISTTIIPIIAYQSELQATSIILCFSIIIFIEYITITYEKLYLVENATRQLALINFISAILCVMSILIIPINTSMFLLPICVIRFISAYIIGWYAYIKWKIFPDLFLTKKSFFSGISISFIVYLIIAIKTNS